MSKRSRKRRQVDRTERVLPTPEAAQHHRPWPMMLLLHAGPEGDGIDSDEFEAGIEIVETFRSLTAAQQLRGADLDEVAVRSAHQLSDRAAMMIAVWFEWSAQVGPGASLLVDWIEDAAPIRSVVVLRAGMRRWLKVKRDMLRSLDTQPRSVLTSPARSSVGDQGHALPITNAPTPIRQVTSTDRRARAPTQSAHRPAASKR